MSLTNRNRASETHTQKKGKYSQKRAEKKKYTHTETDLKTDTKIVTKKDEEKMQQFNRTQTICYEYLKNLYKCFIC